MIFRLEVLGVGRKPPSVLRQHSTKRLTLWAVWTTDVHCLGLLQGQIGRFIKSHKDLNNRLVSLHISWAVSFLFLCRGSRLSYLCRSPVQSEGGLSSAQGRELSTYSQQNIQRLKHFKIFYIIILLKLCFIECSHFS